MTSTPRPDDLAGEGSYSTRPRPETTRQVIANRAGMTSLLFGAAVGLSVLLGRSR